MYPMILYYNTDYIDYFYTDFNSAFDLVNHELLLKVLKASEIW